MDVLYYLVPLAILLGLLGLVELIWALKSGQFDDLEGPAHRILFDDDQDMIPHQPAPTPTPAPVERE